MYNKKQLRKHMLKKRKNLNISIKKKADYEISENLLKVIDKYKSIGIFMNTEEEIDTRKIIEYCLDNKIRVSIPKIINKKMIFVEIKSFDNLILSDFGVLEPIDNESTDDIDLCITPLLSYNSDLNRLGYGGGYYDKYFSENNVYKLGLAYDFQFFDTNLYEAYDIKLDEVIIGVTK